MACQAEKGCASATFDLNFMMDTVTNESFVVGNNGLSSVQNYVGDAGITFVETLGTGAIQTTTIVWAGEAVHSRHTIILDDLVPSQYYGSCQRTGG